MFRDLTEEDIQRMLEGVSQEIANRERQKQELIANTQEKHLDSLVEYLRINRFLDSDMLYEEKAFMDGEQFQLLFEIIMDSAEEMERVTADQECEFHNKLCHFIYKGVNLTFFIMWGQGTCTQVYIADEEWNEELAFTFDELKLFQANPKIA